MFFRKPSLKEILEEKIDYYLNNDLSWWKGQEGKNRAYWYKENVLSRFKGLALEKKVYDDIAKPIDQGNLGTSQDLRNRLAEGLCKHLGITKEMIDTQLGATIQATPLAYAHGGLGLMVIRFNQIRLELLRNAMGCREMQSFTDGESKYVGPRKTA